MTGQTLITRRPETAELIVERTFAATPARLWRCWTTEEVTRWWGPHGWSAVVEEMDLRPGGTWRYSIAPDADPDVATDPPVLCVAVYSRVEEPAVLAFDDGFADALGNRAPGSVPVTVAITPAGPRTHLSITTRFTDAEQLAAAQGSGMDTGFAEALDRLGTHLEGADMRNVTSTDGTTIAYETDGSGAPVVLVGTTTGDHHDLDGFAAALATGFTVHNYDRRGHGDSGDTQPYAPAREVEDLAALLDAIGHPAVLFAGSAGCALALDAATALGDRVSGLYLYEPAFVVGPGRPPVPADYLDRLRGLLAQDRRDEAVELLMTEAVGVPAEYLEPMKADPSWARMVGYAHTIVHDAEILAGTQDGKPLPTDRWNIDAPVHVVVGENSEAFFHEGAQALVALLPNATYATLPGQDHSAFWMAPDSIAASVPGSLRTAAESASR